MTTMATITIAKTGPLTENDAKSTFGTLKFEYKPSLLGFAIEYHDPSVMRKTAATTKAKGDISTDIDRKSTHGTHDVENEPAFCGSAVE